MWEGEPSHFLLLTSHSTELRFQDGPYVVRDDSLATDGGVDAVALVQGIDPTYTFEQERYQRRVIFAREVDEHLPELDRVPPAEVGRGLHAGHHHLHVRVLRACAVDDFLQVVFRSLERQPA